MHWFWRATIAVAVGFVFAVLSAESVQHAELTLWCVYGPLFRVPFPSTTGARIGAMCLWVMPTIIIVIASFGIATYYFKSPRDRETRCRKCGYILRGIPEPRCPECGERI